MYLARYSESPCGAFDELVVLGGLVWNKPLSCAWASRVYVNNEEARKHGVKTCGLPSRRADFKYPAATGGGGREDGGREKKKKKKQLRSLATILLPGFGNLQTMSASSDSKDSRNGKTHRPWWRREEDEEDEQNHHHHFVDVSENKNSKCCAMRLPLAPKKIVAPRIKMFLPSFSGRTKTCPDLMKYSLEMNANVRVSKPIEMMDDGKTSDALTGVIQGKPVVCIAFENMHMSVGKPVKFDLV